MNEVGARPAPRTSLIPARAVVLAHVSGFRAARSFQQTPRRSSLVARRLGLVPKVCAPATSPHSHRQAAPPLGVIFFVIVMSHVRAETYKTVMNNHCDVGHWLPTVSAAGGEYS